MNEVIRGGPDFRARSLPLQDEAELRGLRRWDSRRPMAGDARSTVDHERNEALKHGGNARSCRQSISASEGSDD